MATKLKKVLIVEDERPLARALELKLINSGFNVVLAENGEEALNLIKKEKIDLILLDLIMPKIGGFEFLDKMKDLKKKIPVMVTSNLGQREDQDKAKKYGIKKYFVKSDVNISEIINEVKKFFKK